MLSAPLALRDLRAADLERNDVQFTDGTHVYSTSGKCLGQGGTGYVWLVTRWRVEDPTAAPESVVAKTFRDEVLYLMREDATAQLHYQHSLKVMDALADVHHANIVPLLGHAEIADNHLVVTPLVGESLVALLAGHRLSERDRALLLVDAVRGLAALHQRGIVHRDFTLNNILTLGELLGPGVARHAALFDFDLSVIPSLLDDDSRTYHGYYQGRIAGSPEYSVAPELLDPVLAAQPVGPRIDVYAVGTAIWSLFTDRSVYGDAPDIASLLDRIAEGVVHRGESRIDYPDEVPQPMRPIIELCLERDPQARFADADAVLLALEAAAQQLSPSEVSSRFRITMTYVPPERKVRHEEVWAERKDPSTSLEQIRDMDLVLARYGYVVEKSLGRVKNHPIFLARPDPQQVASGSFPEDNHYPKIVTAIDVRQRPPAEAQAFVETWLGRIRPIVERVRQGRLTSLYKAVHDRASGQLLLFSEYISDPRFGTDLAKHELALEEVFGLGLIVALSIARLHEDGLAHNNVRPESLLFQGRHDVGQVRALFVGLVEPSFDKAARVEDVRNLAQLLVGLIRQAKIDALEPSLRPAAEGLRDDLERLASGRFRTPTIGVLVDAIAGGLGLIEPNFELVRVHGGDVQGYAELLVRHSLYNKLYGGVGDERVTGKLAAMR